MVVPARASALAQDLEVAAASLIDVIGRIGPTLWNELPAPGVWSIGKDVAHVIDAGAYHQWVVRLTIGEPVSSRRPAIERKVLRTTLSADEATTALRARTEEGLSLIRRLTDAQLDMPTRPPRSHGERLAATIERVLIGHYGVHRTDIEAKLAAFG